MSVLLDLFPNIYVVLAGAVEMENKGPSHPKIKNKLILLLPKVLFIHLYCFGVVLNLKPCKMPNKVALKKATLMFLSIKL